MILTFKTYHADQPRSGRSSTARTDKNIKKITVHTHKDYRQTINVLEELSLHHNPAYLQEIFRYVKIICLVNAHICH